MRLGIRPITYNTMTKKPKTESYVRFDWAMKRLLRNKANYGVLEGFLSTLFDQKVRINRILESESNRESEYEKSNRVDLLELSPFQKQRFKVDSVSQLFSRILHIESE